MHPANVRDHAPPPVDATLLGQAVQTILAHCAATDGGLELFHIRDEELGFAYWEATAGGAEGVSTGSPDVALLDLAEKLRRKPAA